MTKPLLSLKWLDDDVKQVEIEIRDGKEPSRIVYPKPKDIEESQYEYARGEFFLRIRDVFKVLYGEHDILSEYGIFRDDSAVLKELICWPRNHQAIDDGNISVDKIPDASRAKLMENIRQMALGWKLSDDIEFDVEPMAATFARFEVDNYIWLFNFEVPTEAKSLLSINKNALEFEWYVFNHDKSNVQKKFSALVEDKSGVGSYLANRWWTNIQVNLQHWESGKEGMS